MMTKKYKPKERLIVCSFCESVIGPRKEGQVIKEKVYCPHCGEYRKPIQY